MLLRDDLYFDRPAELQATAPAETRGVRRDEVRLMVSTPAGHTHARFYELARFLRPGDLVVVNRSATLPASLPATGAPGVFRLHLSTDYGDNLWLAEPRWSHDRPGPLPLAAGELIAVARVPARMIAPFPGLPRLWFVRFAAPIRPRLATAGEPIRYGYVNDVYPLTAYQTIFAHLPGSAEMPSAGRPFTRHVLGSLRARGVKLAGILLHTGVSSLEVETATFDEHPMYPEPFHVPARTAQTVNATRQAGGRVIAVGTTVVRALESAWDGAEVRPAQGFTRLCVHPGRGVHTVDGLISGFHDPLASHLAMLYAIAGKEQIASAYAEAIAHSYLWHEFGDSHLVMTSDE